MAVPTPLSQIEQNLTKIGVSELSPEIQNVLKKLKGGQDAVLTEVNEADSILISGVHLLSKVEADLFQLIPRAVVICNDVATCMKVEELLNTLSFNRDLKTVLIHDKADSVKQRNTLYEGVDIVIGMPKRTGELYFQNGINLKQVKHFIVLEATQIAQKGGLTPILRLCESLPKCQKIIFQSAKHDKLENFIDECLMNPLFC